MNLLEIQEPPQTASKPIPMHETTAVIEHKIAEICLKSPALQSGRTMSDHDHKEILDLVYKLHKNTKSHGGEGA